MSKIVFFGDSGNKDSALRAYRIAYANSLSEAYELIKERAVKILSNNYGLRLNQLRFKFVDQLLNQVDQIIFEKMKTSIKIDNYYYEQSNNNRIRLFRCFLSINLDEAQFNALARKLAKSIYQAMFVALDEELKPSVKLG